jgi:folylpolyglutamate synthase/dihydropteroate synthase
MWLQVNQRKYKTTKIKKKILSYTAPGRMQKLRWGAKIM